jgi:hypothetical protein
MPASIARVWFPRGADRHGAAACTEPVNQRATSSPSSPAWSGHPRRVVLRCSAIFHEYYEQPDSYQGAMRADSHTVGDIAYRDEEGY